MPSGSTPPPTAMQGTPAAWARRATPSAVLPKAVWAVDPALAGDDEVGPREPRVEVGGVHHEVDARAQRERPEPVLDREQRVADAAGRAGARGRALGPTAHELHRVGKSTEPAIEILDVVGRGALLRAVDGRGAGRSAQGVRDVAGHLQLDGREPRIEVGEIDRRRVPVGMSPEAGQQAGAAVGRGAAADAEDDAADAGIQRGPDQVARPDRGRPDRVALVRGQAREAGGRGHLDRRALAVVRDQPARRDLATERIAGGRGPPLPAAGRLDRREGAFAAVGQRAEQDLVVGSGAAPAVGQGLRDLDRGQRALERVGRDEDGRRPLIGGPSRRTWSGPASRPSPGRGSA